MMIGWKVGGATLGMVACGPFLAFSLSSFSSFSEVRRVTFGSIWLGLADVAGWKSASDLFIFLSP